MKGRRLPTPPLLRQNTRFLAYAITLYLGLVTAFLIWRGISVSPDYFLFILLFAAVLLGRWRAFLTDWLPFIAIFLGYEFLRGLAGSSGIPVHYSGVIWADKLIGFGQVPTIWLQQHLYRPGLVSALDVTATLFYFLHFAYPLGLGYLIWVRDRQTFRRFGAAFLGMSFAAFVFFLLVPVAPPWLAAQQGYLPHVEKIINHTIPSQTSWFYEHLNPNKVAAMPSLHAAYPVLGLLYAVRTFGRGAWVLGLWVVAVLFSICYLGEHYVVDGLAGIAIGVMAFLFVEGLWGLAVRRRSAPPGGGRPPGGTRP